MELGHLPEFLGCKRVDSVVGNAVCVVPDFGVFICYY
jgi:hypothetical protein